MTLSDLRTQLEQNLRDGPNPQWVGVDRKAVDECLLAIKDAERYQYIRNRPTPYDDEIWSGIVMREGDDLDAAVDAELERSKK